MLSSQRASLALTCSNTSDLKVNRSIVRMKLGSGVINENNPCLGLSQLD